MEAQINFEELVRFADRNLSFKISTEELKALSEEQAKPSFRKVLLFQLFNEIVASKRTHSANDSECRDALSRIQLIFSQITWAHSMKEKIDKTELKQPESI
jgi:hypothetical protein